MRSWALVGVLILAACGCADSEAPDPTVVIAAAANLDRAIPRLVEGFEEASGVKAVVSLGSTSNLTQQIENGAPFDLFLSADTAHVDKLIDGGFADAASKRIYARGKLVLWIGPQSTLSLTGPEALLDPSVRFISMANPKFAPYGTAAMEVLDKLGYHEELTGKIVHAQSVSMAQQYAASGNVEIAMTALSLAIGSDGKWLELDSSLHQPIAQALAVVSRAPHKDLALQFVAYLNGPAGQAVLAEFGYTAGD